MLTSEENEVLTRVGPGTPMGELLREFWMPVVRSGALIADGAPRRVRVAGENFVAFRATDGRVGFFDEGCPHRCTSLALARNEDNALRCIFHGWKIDVSGKVVEVPSEPPERREEFAAKVRVRHYPVREAGNMIWVYLGKRDQPPRFFDFEFNHLPANQVLAQPALVHMNWFQGLEANLDSAHLGILHLAFMRDSNIALAAADTGPKFELDITPYGFREGALREMAGGRIYARIREYVAPFYSFIPFPTDRPASVFASVPIDDEWTLQWIIYWRWNKELTAAEREWILQGGANNPDNFAADLGNRDNLWHQNREKMKAGHWTGLACIPYEDFVAQESMGPIVDRSREYLGSSDSVIIRTRRMVIEAARAFRRGTAPAWLTNNTDYSRLRAVALSFPKSMAWREVDPINPPVRGEGQPL